MLKEKVINALEKDLSRRYISTSNIQADGRLELDATCISILQPKDGELFNIINDNSSIIIVRNPSKEDKCKVIASPCWDSKRKRLRLSQRAVRILLACRVGFRAFQYHGEIALEAEPFLKPSKIDPNVDDLIELAPFILRSSRSVFYFGIFLENQKSFNKDFTFKLMGEFWPRLHHRDPLDTSFKDLPCENTNCRYCEKKWPIVKTVYWFPIIAFANGYPRPGLISCRSAAYKSCKLLFDECYKHKNEYKNKNVKMYCQEGTTSYTGGNLYRLSSDNKGYISINVENKHSKITIEEKGLMSLALSELETFIKEEEKGETQLA